jgi:putative glutamine amidotransferase
MKKKIGIPGWVIGGEYFGITVPYAQFISRFGEVVILTPDTPVLNHLDLLLLPGGADVNTKRYGESPGFTTGSSNSMLEHFDTTYLQDYIECGVPVFGICRGFQSLNVHFGGILLQEIGEHKKSSYNTDACHKIIPPKASEDIHFGELKVNSRHHQGIIESGLAFDLTAVGYAEDRKDLVECFKHSYLPIWGVQWHPEDCSGDHFSPYVIKCLLKKEDVKPFKHKQKYQDEKGFY